MSIKYLEENRVFSLETANTSYQLKIGEEGYLRHLYYGKRFAAGDADTGGLAEGAAYLPCPSDHGAAPGVIPMEYSFSGSGDYRTPCVSARLENGGTALDLRYESHKIFAGKPKLAGLPATYFENDEAESLEIVLKDRFSDFRVALTYTVAEEYDAVMRSAKIINNSGGKAVLSSALTLCLDYPDSDYDFIRFEGKLAMERVPERAHLKSGKTVCDSSQGISGHSANPFAIICSPGANEDFGECCGFALIYSGNFAVTGEVDPLGQARVTMGINPAGFSYTLENGEELQLPEAVLSYSAEGFHRMSDNFHRLFRQHLCRGVYKDKRRPILVNSWEAFIYDFDTDKLVKLAEDSAKLGIEMLVVDDGWFGERTDDNLQLQKLRTS